MKIRDVFEWLLTLLVALSPFIVVGMLFYGVYLEEVGMISPGHPFLFILVLLALYAADLTLEHLRPPFRPNPPKNDKLDDFLIGPQADELNPRSEGY
jgi:hypothetical protein